MNENLIKKYNTPVPRYTSYPPANYFEDTFSADDYLAAVKHSNNWQPEQVSIYFHIPFCKKMCHYCGCNSCRISDVQSVKRYFNTLKTELRMVSGHIDKNRKVSQIHFGGGTPNSVPPGYLAELMNLVKENFSLSHSPEIAVECNPAYLDAPYTKKLIKAGFNRFSLGIQDFNIHVLNKVNRDQPLIPVTDLVSYIRSENPQARVNLDFIYGLPGQTKKGFEDTINRAIEIKPDRLVTFSYAHVPWVNKAQKILEKQGLPDNDEKAAMYRVAHEQMTTNGYKAIGLDHFVLEQDELYKALESGRLHRNFQGYCTRETTGQVYAFGVSGISQLQRAYAQNSKSIDEYTDSVARGLLPVKKGYALNNAEIIIREVITTLMCNKQINWPGLSKQLGISVPEILNAVSYNQDLLRQFKEDGIVDYSADSIKVTREGSLFIRNVAALFDPLMATTNNKFSRSF